MQYLQHHGIKGQRWGVRRYQYLDGSLTPDGRKRYYGNNKQSNKYVIRSKINETIDTYRTIKTGRQYVDGFIKKNTDLSRIQTTDLFEPYAFYATYKKDDIQKYLGLFGNNLNKRALAAAKAATRQADETGDEADIDKARDLNEKAQNMKIYQLHISSTDKLRIPSDKNASDICCNLLSDTKFNANVTNSIANAKQKMKRPSQQMLFNQALKALKHNPQTLTYTEKVAVYKAFNLTLTNHDNDEIAAQNAFYKALKSKGYSALLDYNDKDYSSYKAKRPVIVFNTSAVSLQSVTEVDSQTVDSLYKKYNAKRMKSEIKEQTMGYVNKRSQMLVSDCSSYVQHKKKKYLR